MFVEFYVRKYNGFTHTFKYICVHARIFWLFPNENRGEKFKKKMFDYLKKNA